MKYLLISILLFSCIKNEGTINIASNNGINPSNNGPGDGPSSGDGSSSEDTPSDEGTSSNLGGDSSSGGDSSIGTNLIFEEDFEYFLSDGTTLDTTGFTSQAAFTSKWTTYAVNANQVLASESGSNKWGPTGSSYWGATIKTVDTFNLPVTIEWDQHQVSHYNDASAYEGLCLYEGSLNNSTDRDAYYHFAYTTTNNLGCILMADSNRVFIDGVFLDGSDSRLTSYYVNSVGRYWYYFHHNVSSKDYRVTVNIKEDKSFLITFQFKDALTSTVTYDGTLNLPGSNPDLDNFHLEFNSGDLNNNRTYFDDIKVWDNDVDPTAVGN